MRSIVWIIFFASVSFAQFENRSNDLPQDTLARIGTHIVSAKDFLERFELMPWPHKDQASRIEYTKLEFLHSLVAEKLLAMEASAQNIGGDSASLNMQRNFERMFVRDELYKREVLPNISISDAERREGFLRYPFEVEAEVLAIVSKHDGDVLRKKILQSKNKSATFKRFNDSLFVTLDTIRATYGSTEKKIEDVLFTLGKDSISLPVEIENNRLVIFRLLKRYTNEQNDKLSTPDRLHKVENIIKQRKEDSLAVKKFASITSPQRAEADLETIFRLADSILAILKADSTSYKTEKIYKFPSSAIALLERQFAPDLSKQFITIESGNMTLGDVLQGLSNNNVLFPSLMLEHIRIVLNRNIKTVIQNELLAREGLRKNLQQSGTVRNDVATWMDNRKSWLLTRSIIDTVRVSDEEIESEYNQHPLLYGATVMVRVKEILVDSVRLAKEIRERLNKDESFSSLAKKYSKRKEWAVLGGESPWIDVTMYGELGLFASSSKIGELNGPFKVKDGFTIYSVIERKIIDDSLRTNFIKAKNSVEKKLLSEKQQKTLNKYIGALAKKYNVSVNESALRKVKTTTTSMVAWRNIGFGGRIVAVPPMVLQEDWVTEWLKQQQVNQ